MSVIISQLFQAHHKEADLHESFSQPWRSFFFPTSNSCFSSCRDFILELSEHSSRPHHKGTDLLESFSQPWRSFLLPTSSLSSCRDFILELSEHSSRPHHKETDLHKSFSQPWRIFLSHIQSQFIGFHSGFIQRFYSGAFGAQLLQHINWATQWIPHNHQNYLLRDHKQTPINGAHYSSQHFDCNQLIVWVGRSYS